MERSDIMTGGHTMDVQWKSPVLRRRADDLIPGQESYLIRSHRAWALANVEQALSDMPNRRLCGHDCFTPECAECAFERGRMVGHVEAGAFRALGD